MGKRLILFLIRTRLGLKKHQQFRFANQKSRTDSYYFGKDRIYKIEGCKIVESSVSLNWLLDKNCSIIKLGMRG